MNLNELNIKKNRSQYWNKLLRALSFTREYRMFLFLILGLTLVVAAANALEPLIMKYIFDRLGGNTTTKTIIVGAGLLLGLGLFRDIIGGFSNWL
ncbi:MAG: ABC transporter ATP-binding protein, partial [Bacteroidota bacterium]